jgi:hypothetical protein
MTQSPPSPATACAVSQKSFFDAVSLLGLGPAYGGPMPKLAPGEISICMPDVSLRELRDNPVAKTLLWNQDWYYQYRWAVEKLPCGIYALRLPVPRSNNKTFDEQKTLLLPGEDVAPLVLAATAMLSIRLSGQPDPVKGDWARCKEQTLDRGRVALYWDDGRLNAHSAWGDNRGGYVWMASARKIT